MDNDRSPRPATALHRVLAGVRVLVVDDNLDQLEIVTSVLAHAGARVVATPTAQEAFDAFQADPPDLVISDIAMPRATGYSLIRRIRSLQAGVELPVVALTAFDEEEHRRKALAAGFTEWIPKPATDTLVAAVARLTGRA